MPDRRRFGRTPDTICLLAAMTLTGLALTVSGQVPNSVLDLVPHAVGLYWSAMFTLSAGVSLVGVLWRDHLTGWALELSGRIGLAGTALAYVVALVDASSHWGTAIVTGVIASIGAASVWRIWQLVRRFGQFKATVLAYKQSHPPRRRRGDHG